MLSYSKRRLGISIYALQETKAQDIIYLDGTNGIVVGPSYPWDNTILTNVAQQGLS